MTEPLRLTVHVKPGSRKGPLVVVDPVDDGSGTSLTVYIQQRAAEGAANEALVRLLATHFGVARRDVSIIRGHSSRLKQVRIDR